MGRKFRDLTGVKSGRWTFQWPVGIKGKGACWLALCNCGNLRVVSLEASREASHFRSCGCLRKTQMMTHGLSKSDTYQTWLCMRRRCTARNRRHWKYYGALGVKVCKRWGKFENFIADMGPRPKGKTLDRYPDASGDYKPSNCRWATRLQQRNNRRVPNHPQEVTNG